MEAQETDGAGSFLVPSSQDNLSPRDSHAVHAKDLGFTLLEVLAVLTILIILLSLTVPDYHRWLAAAAQTRCMANMRSIHVALAGYLNDNNQVWPQGPPPLEGDKWAGFWIATLEPQGIQQTTWECPAVRSLLGNQPRKPITASSIHYTPTLFAATPGAANRWTTHPWLIERASVHGQGPLICFPDGSIKPFNKVLAEQGVR